MPLQASISPEGKPFKWEPLIISSYSWQIWTNGFKLVLSIAPKNGADYLYLGVGNKMNFEQHRKCRVPIYSNIF